MRYRGDGDRGLGYLWTLLEKPEGSAVAPDTNQLASVQFGITADVAGTYLFRLVVTNGSRSSQPEIVVVEATTDEDRLTAPAITPETEDRCGNAPDSRAGSASPSSAPPSGRTRAS